MSIIYSSIVCGDAVWSPRQPPPGAHARQRDFPSALARPAAIKGGGLWCGSSTTINVLGSEFAGNRAQRGGAFFAESPCK